MREGRFSLPETEGLSESVQPGLFPDQRKGETVNMEKLPPIEKIAEAYSALADGRLTISSDGTQARINSSDGTKNYTVCWKDRHYTSNDSATYWAGYPGYPVLAVWMKQGILPYAEDIADQFRNVNWNALNRKYKRKYDRALESVIEERGLNREEILSEMQKVYDTMKTLDCTTGRGKGKP